LPGSRHQEIVGVLPVMREAAAKVLAAVPGTRFVLGLAPTIERSLAKHHLAGGPDIQIVENQTHAVIRAADLILAASGTVTLETALLGTPMVVCYRLSALSEMVLRLLATVPWMSLANLALGHAVVPELHRRTTTSERLSREALRLLTDPSARDAQRAAFGELTGMLGEPGVGARAARLVLAQASL